MAYVLTWILFAQGRTGQLFDGMYSYFIRESGFLLHKYQTKRKAVHIY